MSCLDELPALYNSIDPRFRNVVYHFGSDFLMGPRFEGGYTVVCENNDRRHKAPYIAVCVPSHKIQYEMHIAIFRSLWRRSLFSQTPV